MTEEILKMNGENGKWNKNTKEKIKYLKELETALKEKKELKKSTYNNFVRLNLEDFLKSADRFSEEIIRKLIINYGSEFILKYFEPKNDYYKTALIYILSKYDKNQLITDEKEKIENKLLEDFLKVITKTEIRNREIKKNILENKENIILEETEIESIKNYKSKEYTLFLFFYIFDNIKLERFIKIILKTEDKDLYKWFIKRFCRMEEEIPHKHILDKIVSMNFKVDKFIKIYLEYSAEKLEQYLKCREIKRFEKEDYRKFLIAKMKDKEILRKSETLRNIEDSIENQCFIYKLGIKYLQNNYWNCLGNGLELDGKIQDVILFSLKEEKELKKEIDILLKYFESSNEKTYILAKEIFETIDRRELLKVEETIYNKFSKYDKNKKKLALKLLCRIYNSKEDFLKFCKRKLKTEELMEIVLIESKIKLREIFDNSDNEFDVDKYIDKFYKKRKILPINEEKIIFPTRKDKKDSKKIIYRLLNSPKGKIIPNISKIDLELLSIFTKESCIEFARSLILNWDKETKTKEILIIAIVLANNDLIEDLVKLIKELGSHSKHQLANYLIKGLRLNNSNKAFIEIEYMTRELRHKSSKKAAKEALDLVCQDLNITKDDLKDKFVKGLGLEKGYLFINYGKRSFKIYLSTELKLEIEKEDGKKLKSLPKPNKDDDKLLVEEAKKQFKYLKKELKKIIDLQTERLEEAFITHRLWNANNWKELFMKNSIMNNLGKGLLWGIYQKGKLVKSFLIDTDLFDINYETIELTKEDKIGLVHQLELSERKIDIWKEIFEENERNNLFQQFDREIVDLKSYDFPKISTNLFFNKISKKNWNIDLDKNRSSRYFETVSKEFEGANIKLKISLDRTVENLGRNYDLVDSTDDLIGIENIGFYNLETDKKLVKLEKRIINEMLSEVKKVLT